MWPFNAPRVDLAQRLMGICYHLFDGPFAPWLATWWNFAFLWHFFAASGICAVFRGFVDRTVREMDWGGDSEEATVNPKVSSGIARARLAALGTDRFYGNRRVRHQLK